MRAPIAVGGGFFVFAVLSSARPAAAQEQCPASQVDDACDAGTSGGTCIPATCSTTVDGSTTTTACAVCVDLGPNGCLPSQVGLPCGDAGGTCIDNSSAGFGGGSASGGGGGSGGSTGPSVGFMVTYGTPSCELPSASSPDAGSLRGSDAAPLSGGNGGSAQAADGTTTGATGATSGDGGAAHAAGTSASSAMGGSGRGGCAFAGGSLQPELGASAGWVLLALAGARPRRRRRAPR